jgi:hypothetical protein
MFLEPLDGTYSDTVTMTYGTFIEIFSHLLADFLWFEMDRLDRFPAFPTEKSDLSSLRIEVIFSFFAK